MNSWDLGPRKLPVPPHVSDLLRTSLGASDAPDVAAAKQSVPQNDEQWAAMVNERNSQSADGAMSLAKRWSVSVERVTIAGVDVYRVTPPTMDPRHSEHLYVHLHGGAFVVQGGPACTLEAIVIANSSKMPVFAVDYRQLPDHRVPAGIEDVVTIWTHLLERQPAATLALGGTSAGAILAMTSIHRLKELGLELPGALYLGTPAAEIANVGDSRFINEGIDRVLVSWEGICDTALPMYAGDYDHKHPHVSPIYGDFSRFPPTYLVTGTRDLLLSDTVRVHRKLRAAGVDADLHVYEGLSHGEYLFDIASEESIEHYAELNAFLLTHLRS